MLASLYVPVAVNCWAPPTVTVEFAGVTVIAVSVVGATVTPTACDGALMLPLSSTARARSVWAPSGFGVHT